MEKFTPKKINIFLSVDKQNINSYFNAHDPAPIYKRQLDHQFENYILNAVSVISKDSIVFYKLKCANEADKQYAEPLIYAIKRHFIQKRRIKEEKFSRFKKRTFILLAISFCIVIICHGLVPMVLDVTNHFQSIMITSIDVLSWVMLWRPIDKLIFDWNPRLKDILIIEKLCTAEMIILETKKEIKKDSTTMFVISQAG